MSDTPGWTIVQNYGLYFGPSTITKNIGNGTPTSTTGSISGAQYDAIELQYVANDTFSVLNYVGSISVSAAQLFYASEGGLTWMPVSNTTYTLSNASVLCSGTINGQTGWRLPTVAELLALYSSKAFNGKGWMLGATWSSATQIPGFSNKTVNLSIGSTSSNAYTQTIYLTCVR